MKKRLHLRKVAFRNRAGVSTALAMTILVIVVSLAGATLMLNSGLLASKEVQISARVLNSTTPIGPKIPPIKNSTRQVTNFTLTVEAPEGSGSSTPRTGNYTYIQGTSVQARASSDLNWVFNHWLLDDSNEYSNPVTIVMNTTHNLKPVFTAILYNLTISVDGSGSTNPTSGTHTYINGTRLFLNATASEGWNFNFWTLGDRPWADNPTSLIMTRNYELSATFTPLVLPSSPSPPSTQITLIISTVGQGTVSRSPDQASYALGSTVQVTATPASGWQFDHWDLDESLTSNDNSITVNIDGDHTLKAVFIDILPPSPPLSPPFPPPSPPPITYYTVTIQTPDGSGSTNPPPNSYTYSLGTQVQLIATPASGWVFVGWSGDLSGTLNPVTLTVNGNKAVKATFTQIQKMLTIQSPDGSGSTSPAAGSYTYNQEASLQVTATPSTGWQFSHWNLDGLDVGSLNPTLVSMKTAHTLKAFFTQITYTLIIQDPDGSGTTSPSTRNYSYSQGVLVQVSASPSYDWVFDHWLLDGSSVGSINPITIEMNMTHTLEAVFTQHISSYTVSVSGSIFTTKDPSGSQLYSGSSATTAIQTAINAASSGDTIHLNPATYTLSSTINGKNGVNLLGETGVIISMNNLGVGARAIFYSGSTGSSTTTTLQSMKGTKSITVSSTSGITSGELLFISTTQEWKGNTRHDQQGEIRTVDHISGNTVYLTETLEDTYPSSATVRVINPAKDIEVSSISFTGVQGRNQTGIVFSYGQNLKIHDLFFSHFENYAIGLFNVLNSEVYNNTIYYTNRPGYGYGIGMWFACQNINVHNNYGNTCRHMIAIACAVIPGIPRHIYIYNNTSTKATSAGFDCHSYGEDIQFINNLSTEDAIGMSMGMFSGLVKYNNITNSLYGGIVVGNLVGDDDVVVSYNTITGSKHEGITSRSKNVQILYNTLDYCNSGSVRSYASITLMRGATTDNDEIIYNYSADYCNIYGNTITRSGGANPCPDYYIAPGIVGTTNNKP